METIVLICALALFFKGVVTDESFDVSVMEGDNVTLHTNTDVQQDDLIEWRFGDQQDLLARIDRVTKSLKIYDEIFDNVLDGRFRDRLKMNNQTGDLTITNITTQHTGLYQLDISRKIIKIKIFSVSVAGDKVKTVMVGDSVVLHNNITKKPGDEKMLWRILHNNSPVAEIIGTVLTYNVNGERFRDRLKVDVQTGDLIIINITPDESGSYEVDITVGNNSYTIHRSFNVTVKDPQKDQHGSNKEQDQSPGSSSGSVTAGVICGVILGVLAAVAVGFIIRCIRSRNDRERVSTEDPDGGL